MKYLIVGLGNIGEEYQYTRHNIGFQVLDALASASNLVFAPSRYASVAEYRFKGRNLILIKPSTYMNLSGKAVQYWLNQESVPLQNMLVLVDDLAIPFGAIRVRSKGSDAGHNGLKNINEVLGHNNYSRLRFGIGNNFGPGQQVNYVLGKWDKEEVEALPKRIDLAIEAIRTYAIMGVDKTANLYNNK